MQALRSEICARCSRAVTESEERGEDVAEEGLVRSSRESIADCNAVSKGSRSSWGGRGTGGGSMGSGALRFPKSCFLGEVWCVVSCTASSPLIFVLVFVSPYAVFPTFKLSESKSPWSGSGDRSTGGQLTPETRDKSESIRSTLSVSYFVPSLTSVSTVLDGVAVHRLPNFESPRERVGFTVTDEDIATADTGRELRALSAWSEKFDTLALALGFVAKEGVRWTLLSLCWVSDCCRGGEREFCC